MPMTQAVAKHQERFLRYPPWSGVLEKDYAWVTFVGSKVRHTFAPEYVDPKADRFVTAPHPALDEEYFEWLDLVESLEEAQRRFVMLELGAGYGRWCVNAANFARRHRPDLELRLIPVEAEKTHFAWLKQHIRDNALDLGVFTLYNAAVGTSDGFAFFQMGSPGECYGNSLITEPPRRTPGDSLRAFLFRSARRIAFPKRPSDQRDTIERVRVLSLETILKDVARVDLVDMDVQGTELEVLTASADTLDRQVRRIHIGTHSEAIESGLEELFRRLAWRNVHRYSAGGERSTPWGQVRFGDGVQTWLNEKLAPR